MEWERDFVATACFLHCLFPPTWSSGERKERYKELWLSIYLRKKSIPCVKHGEQQFGATEFPKFPKRFQMIVIWSSLIFLCCALNDFGNLLGMRGQGVTSQLYGIISPRILPSFHIQAFQASFGTWNHHESSNSLVFQDEKTRLISLGNR